MGLDDASRLCNWNAQHKERVRKLLSVDYMSSESSGEESGDDPATRYRKPVLRVKKLIWLRSKYRKALHQIDQTFYDSHKSSRDKLKRRIRGDNSARDQPPSVHQFAVRSELRVEDSHDSSLNSSISASSDEHSISE